MTATPKVRCIAGLVVASSLLIIPALARAAGWRVEPAPTPGHAGKVSFASVSCVSATFCMAVGSNGSTEEDDIVPLSETWNGTSWRIQPVPAPSGEPDNGLAAVSCTAADACVAVGGSGNEPDFGRGGGPVAEMWNGLSWHPSTVPNPTSASSLASVSCTSANACEAVGESFPEGIAPPETLAMTWNGAQWSRQPVVPAPGLGVTPILYGISCVTASNCVAAGSYTDNYGGSFGPIENWNGAEWSVLASQLSAPVVLSSVSCAAAASCVTVGESDAESFDGSDWTSQPITLPGNTVLSALNSVSCSSPTACTAVGSIARSGSGGDHELLEAWNGTTWTPESAVKSAEIGDQISILRGVSCIAPSACTAVGSAGDEGSRTLILREVGDAGGGSLPLSKTPPTVSGSARVGRTLACVSGRWSRRPSRVTYQWVREGRQIPGAASRLYRVRVIDEGTKLQCVTTPHEGRAAGAPVKSRAVTVSGPRRPIPHRAHR